MWEVHLGMFIKKIARARDTRKVILTLLENIVKTQFWKAGRKMYKKISFTDWCIEVDLDNKSY